MIVLGDEGFLESPHAIPSKKRKKWSYCLSVNAFTKIVGDTGHQVFIIINYYFHGQTETKQLYMGNVN